MLIRKGKKEIDVPKSTYESIFKPMGYEPVEVPDEDMTGNQFNAPPNDDPLESMSIEELQAYAAERGIDVGNASSPKGILKKIREAQDDTGTA